MTDLPDDWFEDHDGQSRVLNVAKVAAKFDRLWAALDRITELDVGESSLLDAQKIAERALAPPTSDNEQTRDEKPSAAAVS